MKAAVVRAFKQKLSIKEVPIPEPGPGQVLVKVVACGVCHTDLHAADGDWPVKPSPPLIPGHEAAGFVAAVGPGVTELKEGDKVGVAWLHDSCPRCEYCKIGWKTLCEHQRNSGYSCDGGFAEYVIAAAPFVGRLPDKVDFVAIAPILCAGVTTYKGLIETGARPAQWVAISGVGGLGHIGIQYAKAMGLHFAALDIAPEKLALARSAGADLAVDARAPDAIASIL
jgi:propanol-preferring alcohol dehydrogenase